METIKLKVTGMHCKSCKTLVEETCREVPGVESCAINLASGIGAVTHDGSASFAAIAKEISGLDEKYKVEKL